MPKRQKESYSIQSVDNALDLLEALSDVEEEVRISQLSDQLKMNKTSVFRLLATFENRGYVKKDEKTGKYKLGDMAFEMGQKFLSRMSLLRHAKPVIEKLARTCNEALYLVVPRHRDMLLLDMVDTIQQVKVIPLLGKRYPLTGPAAGQVLLAFNEPLVKNCPENELVGMGTTLDQIRKQGFATDSGRIGEGIVSLAVPLITEQGNAAGSLCMVGPEFRLTPDKVEQQLLPRLIETGLNISSKLGYMGHLYQ